MTHTQPYQPTFMPVGVLTAALQELTPRDQRDADPDLAVEQWLDYAKELGVDCIELSAALHPSLADVPPEAMLDPVANTLDLRDPFDEQRAKRVLSAIDATGVAIADVAYFDDMLHEDPAIRRKKHDFMHRVMDTAVLLGVSAVTGFVGRNQAKSMDQNLIDFEEGFVPLLQAAKDRGLSYRVEQCPMPGWSPGDNFHNNIAYTPAMWIALHKIAERNGVGDQFRIHYDPSHSILMGQDTRSMFQYLADEGYGFLIAGMHLQTSRMPGRSRRCCASTSCPGPPGMIRWPICRTAASTGSTTSSPPASCSTSTSPRCRSSSSTSTPPPGCRTRICCGRSSPAPSTSPATSTGPLRRCTRCSTMSLPPRASPSRASAAKPSEARSTPPI